MKKSVMLFCVLLLSCLNARALEIGGEAPPLEIREWLRGALIDFAVPKEMRKTSRKLTVVVCWGTWLAGARDVTPLLEQLQNKYGDREFRIILISSETKEAVEKFLAGKKNFPCYVALDDTEKTTRAYMGRSRLFPKAFLIDPGGALIWSGEAVDLPGLINRYYENNFSAGDWKKIGKLYEELEVLLRSRIDESIARVTDDILKLNPEDGFAIRARLFYYDSTGQSDKAIEFLGRLTGETPDNAGIYMAAFNILRGQFPLNETKILEFAGTYLRNFEKDPAALQRLAFILLQDFGYMNGSLELVARLLPALENTSGLAPAEKAAALSAAALYRYKTGHLAEAVTKQAEAVRSLPPEEAAEAEKLLKFYESALRLHNAR